MSETPPISTDDAEERRELQAAEMREAIDAGAENWVRETLDAMHPADASDLLEQLSTERLEAVVDLLGGELPAEILIELRDEYREDAVEVMSDEAVVELAEKYAATKQEAKGGSKRLWNYSRRLTDVCSNNRPL